MNAILVCRVRRGLTRSFSLTGPEHTLGRAPGLPVSIPLEGVSSRHARLSFQGGDWWLEDLGSSSGTFLNGERITRDQIRHLDVITLGKNVDLVFVVPGAPRPVAAGIAQAALVSERDGAALEIPFGESLLGRSPACRFRAHDPRVADVHALLERSQYVVVLEDLGGGTLVNGKPVSSAALRDGDVVSLGGLESYRVALGVTERKGVATDATLLPAPSSSAGSAQPRYQWGPEERSALADLRKALSELRLAREEAAARAAPPSGDRGERPAGSPPSPTARLDHARPAPSELASRAQAESKPLSPTASPVETFRAPAGSAEAGAQAPPPAAPTPSLSTPSPQTPSPAGPGVGGRVTVRFTGAEFSLAVSGPGVYQVGRAEECALRIVHPAVSRRHAQLVIDEAGEVFLRDAGSANGTSLNGSLLDVAAALSDGDVVEFGPVQLTVSVERG